MKTSTALITIPAITYTREAFTDRFGHKHKASKVTRKAYRRKTKRRKSKRAAPKNQQWFKPKVKSGWEKDAPLKERRSKTLKAHKGDLLSAARGKQALANVTTDTETQREAEKDAKFFLKEYHKKVKQDVSN